MTDKKKPEWLRIKIRYNSGYVKEILKKLSLNTVCQGANCPNQMECFSKKTAAFMILGNQCTRNCKFCNISYGKPEPVSETEPENIAKGVMELGLKHVVITSVTRDDLSDGGASHFARTVKAVKSADEKIITEVLIPDFQGDLEALNTVVKAQPDIINHNVETVPRLYKEVRPEAIYDRSLKLLKNIKTLNDKILTKSGIMAGLGEKEEEVMEVLKDLRKAECDFLTIGQYLSPSQAHYPVQEYVKPDTFEKYKEKALQMGFGFVASAPLVRSSYNASEMLVDASQEPSPLASNNRIYR